MKDAHQFRDAADPETESMRAAQVDDLPTNDVPVSPEQETHFSLGASEDEDDYGGPSQPGAAAAGKKAERNERRGVNDDDDSDSDDLEWESGPA
ncbi:hypothetical protein OC835_004833 [Tilletia horrida]|uniref:Uncharacterized protein n=1 Tax=Tilletia horrida TaxID=155126 RepID=A0AAN6JL72_9BASI|nr:hypothetical protein OC835_004833 [Tilletia horrida]KAK0533545.1 hypothetical protein OC842_002945 [Tilletia horrida]KAK0556188.1 hypothetical protein OC844_005918 [Tilletia horrida]